MSEPVLYQEYDWHEAVGLFGSDQQARVLCDGQWIIFPDTTLCLTTLGAPPKMSHFEAASRFCWVTDKPPIPQEVIASRNWHPIIHSLRPQRFPADLPVPRTIRALACPVVPEVRGVHGRRV